VQSGRLVTSFEHLKSSLAQSAGELWCFKVMVFKWLTWVLKVKQPGVKGVNCILHGRKMQFQQDAQCPFYTYALDVLLQHKAIFLSPASLQDFFT